MTSPNEVFQRSAEPGQNRIDDVVRQFGEHSFAGVLLADAFTIEDPEERSLARQAFGAIPKDLTPEEVTSLESRIQANAQRAQEMGAVKDPRRAVIRTLKWIGSITLTNEQDIASKNVGSHLARNYGYQGKLAAAALWTERFKQT